MNWYAVVYLYPYLNGVKKVHRDLSAAGAAARLALSKGSAHAQVLSCGTRQAARKVQWGHGYPYSIALDLVKKAA